MLKSLSAALLLTLAFPHPGIAADHRESPALGTIHYPANAQVPDDWNVEWTGPVHAPGPTGGLALAGPPETPPGLVRDPRATD